LRDHILTIGPNGKIKAQIFAKAVIVLGSVTGNVTASEKVDIRDNGSVEGDITSPRVAIAEGAIFRGSVDMQRQAAAPAPKPAPAPTPAVVEAKPAGAPAPAGARP
jgi:cytoskeletal protein CcmA (bactofilin family)